LKTDKHRNIKTFLSKKLLNDQAQKEAKLLKHWNIHVTNWCVVPCL